MLFGYVVGYLVNTSIRELASGTHLHRSTRKHFLDGRCQHSVTVKDSRIARDVKPCTYIGVLYQLTRCHIKKDVVFIFISLRSSNFNFGIILCELVGISVNIVLETADENHSVGIATRYGLDGPGIESRCGEFFITRPDGPRGPHSLLYNAYRFSFPVVKRPGRGVDYPTTSIGEVEERVELYLFSPSVRSRQVTM